MNKLSALVLAALALAGAQAQATTITFDEFAATNSNTALTGAYSAQGVVFGNDNSGTWGGTGQGDPGNWGVAGTNGTQFLGNNGVNGPYSTTISFASAQSLITFDASRTNGSSGGQTLTVDAYTGSTLVSASTVTLGAIDSWSNISISGAGITSLVLQGSVTGFSPYGIDNLSFSTSAVPEPATLSLMAAGLGLFGWSRKRRA